MPTTPHPENPAEGSREAVDRQLKKSGPKKGDKTDGKSDQQQEDGKRHGPGSEEAGRD
ncbi:hypothetical protein [Chelativorans sp. YIM 93263]|uniref:hypothetical protein n=1 Tax=Chelativorans sp. YIM 93263 TaxID=2906648 RepID=UPI0023797654|nr:hypothetical protein [Chelativorans sp. YIM 93263]